MPVVPIYSSPQVAPTLLPDVRQRAPEVRDFSGAQNIALGETLSGMAGEYARVLQAEQEDANRLRVQDALNQAIAKRTDLRLEAAKLRGRAALERPDGMSLADEFGKRFDDETKLIGETLGNDAQRRAFALQTGQIGLALRENLSNYMLEQQKVFREETRKATVLTATNQAVLLYNDPEIRQQSIDAIRRTVDEQAADSGWDKTTREAALVEAMSPMHAGVMRTMLNQGMSAQAKSYYEAHSAQMTMQDRANLQGALRESTSATKAEESAQTVWGELGPKGINDPVRIFDMEQSLREKLKDDPDALQKGLTGLRQRAQAFNAQQTEYTATNISGVWKMIDPKAPALTPEVMRSDAWLALTDTQRRDITRAISAEQAAIENREYTREQRAYMARQRVLAEEERAERRGLNALQRQLTEMQVNDRLALMRNGDKFLTVSDPEVLRRMSRAQVEAMRTDFGFDAAQQLLGKWDTLQRPEKLAEAKMDQEDFNLIADRLGLKPFARDTSENHKRALGTLKQRIEQAIDLAQLEAKRPLSREEKSALMQQEMARTVTVNPGWFSFNKDVPVVQLTDEQIKQVVVPAADRQRIVAKMAERAKTSSDARFNPTEDNVRYWYLLEKSPVAGRMMTGAR